MNILVRTCRWIYGTLFLKKMYMFLNAEWLEWGDLVQPWGNSVHLIILSKEKRRYKVAIWH